MESLLQEMLNKYQRQHDELQKDILVSLRKKEDKQKLLHKLRRKKIVLHYMELTRKKIQNIISKQYALENLNITKLQLNAIKETVQVFKSFSKTHSYEKIENLKDQLDELTEQFMETDSILNEESPLLNFDDSELEQELETLNDSLEFPTVPIHEVEMKNAISHTTAVVLEEKPLQIS